MKDTFSGRDEIGDDASTIEDSREEGTAIEGRASSKAQTFERFIRSLDI